MSALAEVPAAQTPPAVTGTPGTGVAALQQRLNQMDRGQRLRWGGLAALASFLSLAASGFITRGWSYLIACALASASARTFWCLATVCSTSLGLRGARGLAVGAGAAAAEGVAGASAEGLAAAPVGTGVEADPSGAALSDGPFPAAASLGPVWRASPGALAPAGRSEALEVVAGVAGAAGRWTFRA